MPQLMPYFFFNQVTFTFISLLILIYFFSKYALPEFFSLRVIHTFFLVTVKNFALKNEKK